MPQNHAYRGRSFPRERALDSTLALLREGYQFISRRCEQHCSEAFETRLMLRKVICARGMDAAAMFYHPDRFTRKGAIPPTTVALLQDLGSVQQLDGEDHRHRKQLFLKLLDGGAIARLVRIMLEEWRSSAMQWPRQDRLVLHDEVEEILCRAACRWAGVPLSEPEARARAREFGAMIDGAGAFGPRLLRGWRQRRRTEAWIESVIRQIRSEDSDGAATPAGVIARHRQPDGSLLDDATAAVEVINLLRPIVAVARWVTFAAVALHDHPAYRLRLQAGEPRMLLNFVHEVRRFYPFFPMVGGRVIASFEWRGRSFQRGEWVLLDLYGTNHDPRLWEHPERFDPDRFRDWQGSEFDFIAQGGGDVTRDHRCPGENPAIALLMAAVGELAVALEYEVPPQDLSYRLNRMPSIPESRFIISNVRPADQEIRLRAAREAAHA